MTHRARFDALLEAAVADGASGLHIVPGQAPRLRVGGRLRPHGEPLDAAHTEALARELFGERRLAQQASDGIARLSLGLPGRHARVTLASSRGGYSLSVRLRMAQVPSLEACDVPAEAAALLEADHGLLIVSGPHASGKTTTLYALVESLNAGRDCHICTVEDPVEYVFEPKRALIQQREVGTDVPDLAGGIAAALDQDLDVLMVRELHDLETVSAVLHAAETGHLVLIQVHAADPIEALERLIESTPESMHGLVRRTLAETLLGVTTQRLLPAVDRGRRAAVGVLLPDDGLRQALLDGEPLSGQAGAAGSVGLREAITRLRDAGRIGAADAEAALEA